METGQNKCYNIYKQILFPWPSCQSCGRASRWRQPLLAFEWATLDVTTWHRCSDCCIVALVTVVWASVMVAAISSETASIWRSIAWFALVFTTANCRGNGISSSRLRGGRRWWCLDDIVHVHCHWISGCTCHGWHFEASDTSASRFSIAAVNARATSRPLTGVDSDFWPSVSSTWWWLVSFLAAHSMARWGCDCTLRAQLFKLTSWVAFVLVFATAPCVVSLTFGRPVCIVSLRWAAKQTIRTCQ